MHMPQKQCMSLILTKHPELKSWIDEMLQAYGDAWNYSLMVIIYYNNTIKKCQGRLGENRFIFFRILRIIPVGSTIFFACEGV